MSRGIGVLVVLILLAFGAAYLGSPIFAFHQLQQAAASGDRERLDALVDFPAVREDLKRQVDSKATKLARTASGVGYPIAAILGRLGAAIGDRAIDRLVTPDAISAMIQFGQPPRGRRKDAAADPDGAATRHGVGTKVHFAYLTPDRVRARVAPAADPERPVDLILERHGLVAWRLEAIELPK